MELLQEMAAVLVGLALRLGVPIGMTALLVGFLHRLDARWRAEADRAQAVAPRAALPYPPCCELKGCTPERRAGCSALNQAAVPCWQMLRDAEGHLQERCLGCEVFRAAPVPSPV